MTGQTSAGRWGGGRAIAAPATLCRRLAALLGQRAGLFWLTALCAGTVLTGVALAFEGPGFIDAYYNYHVAVNIASGRGFTEDIIWTYLTRPEALTHPSHLYWMPLVSLTIAPFLVVFGESFRAAQVPFILLGAAVPAATALLGRQMLAERWQALAAAALVLFSGYYLVYWTALDAFALFALASGGVFLATAALIGPFQRGTGTPARARSRGRLGHTGMAVLLGVAAGAAHLTRADGVLLLPSSLALVLLQRSMPRRTRLLLVLAAVAGYALVMAPWFLRNYAVAGTPLPSGGLQTAFLREYNEIFSYQLTLDPSWYFGQDPGAILESKAVAGLKNLGVLFGLQYWLVPFAIIGTVDLLRSRHRHLLLPPLVYGAALYLVMTLVFTFPSGRGSMLHSSVALLPWLAVAAVEGIQRTVFWVAARRSHWTPLRARRNFTLIFLGCSVAVSCYVVQEQARTWERQETMYREAAPVVFADRPDAVAMVLNAPGWWYVTRRPALQTPSDGPDAALAAARRFGATHLVMEPAYPAAWEPFRTDPAYDSRFQLLAEIAGQRLYRLLPR